MPVQPIDTSLMPRYEAPDEKVLKLGQVGYYNAQTQLTQLATQQAIAKANAQQISAQAMRAAMDPNAVPDATNTTPAQMRASAMPGTGPNPLINRTGQAIGGVPTLGSVGAAPARPAAAPAVPDMSTGAVLDRYVNLARSQGVPADVIANEVKTFNDAAVAQQNESKAKQDRRAAMDQDAIDGAFADAGGDWDKTRQLALKRGASPGAIQAFDQLKVKTAQGIATLKTAELDNQAKAHDQEAGSLLAFVSNPSMLEKTDGWPDLKAGYVRSGYITQAESDALPAVYPGDEAVKRMANGMRSASQLMKDELDKRNADRADATAKETARHNQAMEDAKPKTEAEFALAAAGGDPEKALTRLDESKRNARPVTNVYGGVMTEDDFARAGEEYARTGVMPPMGMGGGPARERIIHYKNEFARKNGLSPADIVTMQAAYAGDRDSLKKLQVQRDQINSFEATANKNLDLFLDAASKIPDSGVPWLNKVPLRMLDEKLVGSADMAAVNAARSIATNEIAKVTSGGSLSGVLSDAARQEVKNYNPADATFAQTIAVARVLKQDMANRHQALDETLSDIKSRIGGAGTPAPASPISPVQSPGKVTVVDPRGVAHVFPDQQKADEFKRLADIH